MFNIKTATYIKTITVADVYGSDEIVAPKGWEIVDFRPAISNDHWLDCSYRHNKIIPFHGWDTGGPRLIVTPVKVEVVTFTATGEYRTINRGDYYKSSDGEIYKWAQINPSSDFRFIYTREITMK